MSGLAAVVVLAAAAVAWRRPAWALPIAIVLLPLRLSVGDVALLPTLVVAGVALGRAPAIARQVARRPLVALVLAVLPLWVVISGLWARQPLFALDEAAKWLAVAVAALVALADERRDPRPLVVAAGLALVPSALWALGERLHVIEPLGDPEELRLRLIHVGDLVRGRALFYHPNRLAELVEQLGLLLAACAVCGPLRVWSAIGAALALAGTWASGSTAAMAAMGGGGALTIAALVAWRSLAGDGSADAEVRVAAPERTARGRRIAVAIGALGAASAIAAAASLIAYQVHGGLGPRTLVYRQAWRVILRQPLLGVGGGNWGFEVASDPMRRFWFSGHTHSLVLQVWVELGIVGVALLLATLAVPIALALRAVACGAPAWRGIAAGSAAGVAGLFAHDLVHFFLREPADGLLTGILLGLAAASTTRRDPAA